MVPSVSSSDRTGLKGPSVRESRTHSRTRNKAGRRGLSGGGSRGLTTHRETVLWENLDPENLNVQFQVLLPFEKRQNREVDLISPT